MNVGRILGTAIVGFFLFLFLALDLVLFGVLALDSALVTMLPILGVVLGAIGGGVVGKRRRHS